MSTPESSIHEQTLTEQRCEASRSYGYDPTGENAVTCGAPNAEWDAELEIFVCGTCKKEMQ